MREELDGLMAAFNGAHARAWRFDHRRNRQARACMADDSQSAAATALWQRLQMVSARGDRQ